MALAPTAWDAAADNTPGDATTYRASANDAVYLKAPCVVCTSSVDKILWFHRATLQVKVLLLFLFDVVGAACQMFGVTK